LISVPASEYIPAFVVIQEFTMSSATDRPRLSNRLIALGTPTIVVAPESSTPPHFSWLNTRVLVVALILLGIGFRLVPLIQNRDLWIDEAMLALNLVERSPARLLEPLDWNQGAPVGFLLLMKGTITLVGTSEWGLRLFPFTVSLLGLLGFAWLARRMLPTPASTLALALMALNPILISYAAECKQYALDAAITVGLFGLAFRLLQGACDTWRLGVLTGCGTIAVWFSHPAAFVLGGIGTALFLDAASQRDRKRIATNVAMIGCWLASFALCYFLTQRHLGKSLYLLDYWSGHFWRLPTSSGDVAWLIDHGFGFFAYPGGLGGGEFKVGGIAALLGLVGVAAIWRDRWQVAVAMVVPVMLVLLASGLHKYPFAGRLLLFLVPLMLLAVARGTSEVVSALRPSQLHAAGVMVGVLLLAPLVETLQQISRPMRHEQITEVLATVRDRVQPGDKVYLYYSAVPAFTFYTRNEPLLAQITIGSASRQNRTVYRDELRKFAGEPRVWVIFAHRHGSEESQICAYAESLGNCEEEVRRSGAAAYRYDFRTAKER